MRLKERSNIVPSVRRPDDSDAVTWGETVLAMNALSIGFRVYLRGKKKW